MKTRELEHRATRKGCRLVNGGRHPQIVTPSGERVSYTCHGHGQEIARGTLRAILKRLAAAGVVLALPAACIALRLLAGG